MTTEQDGTGACVSEPVPEFLVGRYRLQHLLGSGGMGEVWLAHDEHLRREVAVKLLPEEVSADPKRLARFRREGLVAAALSHPNICTVFEVGDTGRRPFIVMEYVKGQNLHDRVSGDPLGITAVVELGIQVADALAEAHSHGLIHRDIKSGNIVVTAKHQIKVLDFGLAKQIGPSPVQEDTTESLNTGPGERVGTLPYMSPEQALGLEVDHRTDLFSLGVVLYELLTGRLPFHGRSGPELVDRILHSEPPSISRFVEKVPEAAVSIVRKLMAKDPEDRYQAAREVVVDLRRLKADLSDSGRVGAVGDDGQEKRLRRQLWVAAAAVLLTVSVFSVWWLGGPQVTRIRLEPITHTTTPGWEACPALSPDGGDVAYCAETDGNIDLWVMDSFGGASLRLTDHPGVDCGPAWLAGGREILFFSNRTGSTSLWRIGRLGGSATLVLENAYDPAVSRDGTRIAFSRPAHADAVQTIWTAPLDDPKSALQITPDGLGTWDHQSPSFSPDGGTIAFADFQDVWLVPADGSEMPRRLTDGASSYRDPVWLPDGRTLLMTSWREGTVALWTLGVDGRGLARVTTGTGPEIQPSISDDGAVIAYSTHQEGQTLIVTDLASGHRARLESSARNGSPDMHPDGEAVVFSSDRSGSRQLWLQPLIDGQPDGDARQLTSGTGRSAVPSFSPDGSTVAFYRIFEQQRSLCLVSVIGGPVVQITDGGPNDVNPSFSPDGRSLVFARMVGSVSEIWRLELDSGGAAGSPRPFFSQRRKGSFPMWSPTGDHLAFLADGDAWVVSTSSNREKEVGDPAAVRVTRDAAARDLAWTSDGRGLFVSGMWGGNRLELRRVDDFRNPVDFELIVEIGDPRAEGTFGVSRDDRFFSTVQADTRGDIWVARVNHSKR